MADEKPLGKITHYFSKIGVGIIKLTGPLKVGDQIQFKGHTTDFTQMVDSIQLEHRPIQAAKKGDEVGIKAAQKVREGDQVYPAA